MSAMLPSSDCRDRRRSRRPDGGRGAGAGRRARSRSTTGCPRPGRKFLLAGRGGLNLTHSEELSTLSHALRCGDAAVCDAAIEAFPPAAVRGLVRGAWPGHLRRIERSRVSRRRSRPRRCCAPGCGGSMVRASTFEAPSSLDRLERAGRGRVRGARGTRERSRRRAGAGARRRELAAARFRWRVGGHAGARPASRSRRCGRRTAALSSSWSDMFPRALRGPAAEADRTVVRRAIGAGRSDRHRAAVLRAAASTHCRRRCAMPSPRPARRILHIALRPDLPTGRIATPSRERRATSNRCPRFCARP